MGRNLRKEPGEPWRSSRERTSKRWEKNCVKWTVYSVSSGSFMVIVCAGKELLCSASLGPSKDVFQI